MAYIDTPDGRAALDGPPGWPGAPAALRLYTVVADEAEATPLSIGRDAERAFLDRPGGVPARAGHARSPGCPDVPGHRRDAHRRRVEGARRTGRGVDVLFCGSRRYGPVRRVLLGGVSSRLVRRARSPLIVVPRAE